MRLLLVALLASCGVDPPDEVFGFAAPARNLTQPASAVGLWVVTSPAPGYTFKLGDGTTVINAFDISFDREPPENARNAGGIGIALIGLLPGLATLPDGVVEGNVNLIGLTTNHAVVFKLPGATGQPWAGQFPDGFSCGQCIRTGGEAPDELEPIDCSLVIAEALVINPCSY
ncbi:MAG: hypothetical protein ABI867_09990 [Kofleriaceae bacterium]